MATKRLVNTDGKMYDDEASYHGNEHARTYGTTSEDITYTVDDAIEQIGFGRFQVFVMIFLTSMMAAYAFEATIVSAVAVAVQCEWKLTNLETTIASMVSFLGMVVAGLIIGVASDKVGRVSLLLISNINVVFYSVLVALAPSYKWFVIFRFLVGFFMTGVFTALPLAAEFVPVSTRGSYLLVIWTGFVFGTVLQAYLDYLIIPTIGWRILIIVSTFPYLIFIFGSYYLPESPRYYLVSGYPSKATRVLERMAAINKSTLPPGRLVPSRHTEMNELGQLRDLFSKQLRRGTITLLVLGNVGTFVSYGTIFLTTTLSQGSSLCVYLDHSITSKTPTWGCNCMAETADGYWITFMTSFGDVFALPLSLFVNYMFGRKRSMCILSAVGAASLFLSAICVNRAYFITVSLFARCSLSAFIGVYQVYISEYFPTTVRGTGTLLCMDIGTIGGALTPFVGQLLVAYAPISALSVYGSCCILVVFIVLTLPVDTSRMSLTDNVK